MTKKEYVQKYGGKFSIEGGETWTMPNGHVVHFALNPKMGCRNTNISEEILLIFSGEGECYLYDKWIPCKAGDIIFAPPGVWHGTRNPAGNTEPFVTLGIATPPQQDLFARAGYDVLDDDKTDYVGEYNRPKED